MSGNKGQLGRPSQPATHKPLQKETMFRAVTHRTPWKPMVTASCGSGPESRLSLSFEKEKREKALSEGDSSAARPARPILQVRRLTEPTIAGPRALHARPLLQETVATTAAQTAAEDSRQPGRKYRLQASASPPSPREAPCARNRAPPAAPP